MIEVKGTKDSSSSGPTVERYAFPVKPERSRKPAYIALLVLGLLAYLRSTMPLFSGARAEEDASGGGEASRQTLHPDQPALGALETAATNASAGALAPMEDPIRAGAPEAPIGSFAPDETIVFAARAPVYAGNVVPFPHRLVDSPALDFAPVPGFGAPPTGGVTDAPLYVPPENPNPGSASPTNPASPDEDEEPDGPEDPDRRNRTPVTTGPVRLNEASAGTAVMIGLSELLVNASDADGDALTIRNVKVTSGSVGVVEGGLVYSSNAAAQTAEIAITYEVFDGVAAVTQTAYIPLFRNPLLSGTDGDDVLVGTADTDHIDALDGGDLINAGAGDDVIIGGAGDDHIIGGMGRDIIRASSGDDIVFAGPGDDLVSGGEGNDSLFGEAGADTLLGEAGDDVLSGGDGDDWLSGGEGHDQLDGAAGSDIIEGGAGDDIITDGPGRDTVFGDNGDDVVLAALDGEEDVFEGGAGTDTFDLSKAELQVAVDLMAGTAIGAENGSDRIAGFETVRGGSGDDLFWDGAGSERISGGSGDDVVYATADASDDCFAGEAGSDTLDYSAVSTGVAIDLERGAATGLEIGEDAISGFECFIGSVGNDVFEIGATSVKLTGGSGADLFSFDVPMVAADAPRLIHDILDFVAGDRVLVAHYEFTFSRSDEFEDRFSRYYNDRDEVDAELELRIRHRNEDGQDLTVFDFDYDGDLDIEMTIILFGHHQPLIYDGTTA